MTLYIYPEIEEEFISTIKALPESDGVSFYPFVTLAELSSLDLSSVEHIVTTGTISEIKQVMLMCQESDISMGIVPLPSQSSWISSILDLPPKTSEAFIHAIKRSERKIDAFYCNDILVLDDVRIGNTILLKEFEYDYLEHTFIERLKRFWHNWRHRSPLRHHSFTVQTDEQNRNRFSAVGIIALDYDNRSWIASALDAYLGSGDGKHLLAILSPTSLWQYYIKQPIDILISKRSNTVPSSMGFIKNDRTVIECDEPVEVLVDDTLSMQTPVQLRTVESALALSVGDKFWERQSSVKSTKSNIKLNNIPKDEERINYLSEGLPLFERASKEQYATLFRTLREEGRLSGTFMTLLILATLIATFGLFINSGSVIIGAMLLAPLMQPIVSLSMGVLRQDAQMQQNAIYTIAIGVVAVLISSALVAYFTPLQRVTSEMAGRLSPTILDLFVAIVSGVAAAYVKNNEKILSSLAGVAIAVALVPPVAVAGIGIGWGDWHMFYAAFLLFVTNLAGIVLAASVTFMMLGYSPINIARKGLTTWLVIVALVAIPLYGTFGQMRENSRIQNILTHTYFNIAEKKLELNHIEIIRHKGRLEIRCEVISDGILTIEDKEYLKEVISKSVGRDVDIIATFRYRL